MLKYIDVKGRRVVDNRGNCIGSVESFIINARSKRVISLLVCNNSFMKGFYIIPLKCVKSFNEPLRYDRMFYRVRKAMLVKNKDMILENYMDSNVVNREGDKLGRLSDLIFDAESGYVKALILTSGFFDDMFDGRNVILVNENTIFNIKRITVEDCIEIKNDVYFKKYLRE